MLDIDAIETLRQRSLEEIRQASSLHALRNLRVQYLGRGKGADAGSKHEGEVTSLLKAIRTISDPSEKKRVGAAINRLKEDLTAIFDEREELLLDQSPALSTPVDTTVPGIAPQIGGRHPTTQMIQDLNEAFISLNFEVFDGPEISSELFDFDNLNFPPSHPARDVMDTYWLAGHEHLEGAQRLCLRPHLTGGSVRFMKRHRPPFRFVYPGRVYRNESIDASHERAFYQYEALIVDRDVPFTAGRLLIRTILETVFGQPVETRMRAGFFPFVEPGFEIDMRCLVCAGKGCHVCKRIGWLEVMPGGAPHPNVLRAGGLDPDEWMGFYINIGLDRLVLMRHAIEDIRLLHGGELRFLTQFR